MINIVGYSGGADSQVALDIALKLYDDVRVVFCDTSLEFPETLATIKKTEQYYGIKIDVLRAPKTFEEYLTDFGGMYPTLWRRWCTERLKERPLIKYVGAICRTEAKSQPVGTPREFYVTSIDGIRKNESRARSKRTEVEVHKRGKWRIEHIIFNWTKPEVYEYIRLRGLPLNPLYGMGYSRTGCWFCPYATKTNNRILQKAHPELYAQALGFAAKWGRDFCYPVVDCEEEP